MRRTTLIITSLALLACASVLHAEAGGARPESRPSKTILKFLSPGADQQLRGGTKYEVRWTLSPDPLSKVLLISYSPDNGITWRKIDAIPGKAEKFVWEVPKINSTKARLLLQVQRTDIYTTSKPFIIDSVSPLSFLPGETVIPPKKDKREDTPFSILHPPARPLTRKTKLSATSKISSYEGSMDLATELIAQGRFKQARVILRKTAAKYPKRAEVFYFLARSWKVPDEAHSYSERQKALNAAVFHLEQATKLDPAYSEAWNDLGLHYAMDREYEKAEMALKKAVALRGEPYQNYNLGLVCLKLKKPAEAIKNFREALRMKPKMREAVWNLGKTLEQTEKFEAAKKMWSKAAQLYGPHSKYGAYALERARNIEKNQKNLKKSKWRRLFGK